MLIARWVMTATVLCCLASCANVNDTSISGTPMPGSIHKVRGEDSIMQAHDLGPSQTAFWLRLQNLIKNKDALYDLNKISTILDIPFEASPNSYQDPNLPLGGYPVKLGRRSGMVDSISYGVTGHDDVRESLGIAINLSIPSICITSSEVHRVFGWGNIRMGLHQRPLFQQLSYGPQEKFSETAGLLYSELYGSTEKVFFSYAIGGCLDDVTIRIPLAQTIEDK